MDALSTVAQELRVAQLEQQAPDFWREHNRRRAMNHVALMLAGRSLIGDPHDPAARDRMIAAINEYREIGEAMRARVDGRAA